MSATPIPRTLAIILYGDLQVSELRELPAGRLPIKNLAMPQAGRGKALRFILRQIAAGRQAYIICPAVEEGMMEELENVTDYTEKLRGALPAAIRIASLHGRMRPAEKDAVMEAFAAHETDILVSTTVVEVGINVPNATVMMVECRGGGEAGEAAGPGKEQRWVQDRRGGFKAPGARRYFRDPAERRDGICHGGHLS